MPSSCDAMVSLISRSNTPDCCKLVEISSNRKSAGTTVPIGSSAVRRMASVDDPQLRAQLSRHARAINCTQCVFPEASPDG